MFSINQTLLCGLCCEICRERLYTDCNSKDADVLTGTQRPLVAQAVEVIAFAVFAPHLSELVCVAGALSAQAVASPAADRTLRLRDAVGVIGRTVVLHRTLAPRAQATVMTLTHAALEGAVAVAADGAVGFGPRLAVAAAGEIHRHLQRVLEAQGFDGESAALLFGATTQLSLHAERHLRGRGRVSFRARAFHHQRCIVSICANTYRVSNPKAGAGL